MFEHETAARAAFFDAEAGAWDGRVASPAFLARLREAVDGLAPGADEVILDLGCGTGNLTAELRRRLSPDGRVLAADISEGMLTIARTKIGDDPRVTWLHTDAAGLPVPCGSVDRVICFSAWPHFPHPEAVAVEMGRLLRPGGMLHVLHVDGRETINRIHCHAGGPVRHDLLPEAASLAALLENAGFELVRTVDVDDRYEVSAVWPGSAGR